MLFRVLNQVKGDEPLAASRFERRLFKVQRFDL